jgi:putative methionine-R-sulfoxide reductase with GAF domain
VWGACRRGGDKDESPSPWLESRSIGSAGNANVDHFRWLHRCSDRLSPGDVLLTVYGCVFVAAVILSLICFWPSQKRHTQFPTDTDRADRAKKAKELQSIFESVMTQGNTLVDAERATLFMLDTDKGELWSRVATGNKGIIKVPLNKGIAGACVTEGKIVNIPDAYEDQRFNQSVDRDTGYRTRSVLAIPLKDDEGEIIGAIQMINKKNKDGTGGVFNANDEKLLTMLASHVTTFTRIVNGH